MKRICAKSIGGTNIYQTGLKPVLYSQVKGFTQMSLFNQGWKAETTFGDDVTAHHMNSRSVYRFKENDDISIIHTAVRKNNEWVDQFTVCQYKITEYHESGNVLSSESKVIEDFDNWLEAYYCGVQCINNLNMELVTN